MRYSIEPRDRIYVKGYGFLSFAKNVGKNLSNKYSQKLIDTAKKSTTDAIQTASKRAIQKTADLLTVTFILLWTWVGSGLLISMLGKFSWFRLTDLITMVLLM